MVWNETGTLIAILFILIIKKHIYLIHIIFHFIQGNDDPHYVAHCHRRGINGSYFSVAEYDHDNSDRDAVSGQISFRRWGGKRAEVEKL